MGKGSYFSKVRVREGFALWYNTWVSMIPCTTHSIVLDPNAPPPPRSSLLLRPQRRIPAPPPPRCQRAQMEGGRGDWRRETRRRAVAGGALLEGGRETSWTRRKLTKWVGHWVCMDWPLGWASLVLSFFSFSFSFLTFLFVFVSSTCCCYRSLNL
jgi:hypothetical protein